MRDQVSLLPPRRRVIGNYRAARITLGEGSPHTKGFHPARSSWGPAGRGYQLEHCSRADGGKSQEKPREGQGREKKRRGRRRGEGGSGLSRYPLMIPTLPNITTPYKPYILSPDPKECNAFRTGMLVPYHEVDDHRDDLVVKELVGVGWSRLEVTGGGMRRLNICTDA